MSTQTVIVIVAVIAVVVLLAARRARPRVTQIDRTVTRDEKGGDDA